MDNALVGFLALFSIVHILLIAVPIGTTLRAPISVKSKILWVVFLLIFPFIGVALFHFRYRSSLFLGKPYEPTPHDLGVRNCRDSPDDRK
jgi:hypothetical protein